MYAFMTMANLNFFIVDYCANTGRETPILFEINKRSFKMFVYF